MANPDTKFAFFDVSSGSVLPPYKMNEIFDINGSNEASLYNSIYAEFTYLYGTDVIFIERDTKNEEPIFGEFLTKVLTRGTPMRLFVSDVSGWGGMGDLYSKLGALEIRDQCILYCPKITLQQARPGLYPKYHDLVYIPKARKLFEIDHIEDELPPAFYLLGNRSGYVITCTTYVYDHSEIDSTPDNGIPVEVQALDKILQNTIDNLPGVTWDVQGKDIAMNNTKVEATDVAEGDTDTSEVDPVTGV